MPSCRDIQAEHPEWVVTADMVRQLGGSTEGSAGLSLAYKVAAARGTKPAPLWLEHAEAGEPLMPLVVSLYIAGKDALAKQLAAAQGVPWDVVQQCRAEAQEWVEANRAGIADFVLQGAKIAGAGLAMAYGGAALAGATGGGGAAAAGAAGSGGGAAGGASGLAPISVPASASHMAVTAAPGVVLPSAATAGAATLQSMPAASAILEAGAAGSASTATLAAKAKAIAPKVVERVNQARTIKAVAEGEAPPPPLDLEGDSFRDWAVSLGKGYIEQQLREQQQELTEAEQRELDRQLQAEVRRLQREAAGRLEPAQRRWGPGPETQAIFEAGESARVKRLQNWLKGGVTLGALAILYAAAQQER